MYYELKKMSRRAKIVINICVTLFALGYFVVSIVAVASRNKSVEFSALNIDIKNSKDVSFLSNSDVERLIFDSVAKLGMRLKSIPLGVLETVLENNNYVESANVFSSIDGTINIELTQRVPCFRVLTENGYDFYVDSSMVILKTRNGYYPKVITVSGKPCFDFDTSFYGELNGKNSDRDVDNLKKLFNFVEYIKKDSYLKDFTSQIYLFCNNKGEFEVEIIPSIGSLTVLFGSIVDSKSKLDRLSHFFRTSYRFAHLDSAKVVDVRFNPQILVR